MNAITTNFKNMLLYIGKVGSKDPTCPMHETILGTFIDYLFNDQARVSRIPIKYMESRDRLDTVCQQNGTTVVEAIKNKDRSIFNHISLFPDNVSSQYGAYIKWFSTFLVSGMDNKYMDFVWRYLAVIDDQCLKEKAKHTTIPTRQ